MVLEKNRNGSILNNHAAIMGGSKLAQFLMSETIIIMQRKY